MRILNIRRKKYWMSGKRWTRRGKMANSSSIFNHNKPFEKCFHRNKSIYYWIGSQLLNNKNRHQHQRDLHFVLQGSCMEMRLFNDRFDNALLHFHRNVYFVNETVNLIHIWQNKSIIIIIIVCVMCIGAGQGQCS